MKKIEQVYREVLYQALEKENMSMTQLELSKKLIMSLSTVNLALKNLEKMNSIKIQKMNFKVIDIRKILYYWASIRNIEKDIIYKTRVELSVKETEKSLPDIIYGAYSAYKFRFRDVPADYSETYVYADEKELEIIKKRFPQNEEKPNFFVLKKDENMKYSKTGTIAQIFADLWNLRQWYADDFVRALEKRLIK